MDKLRSTMGLVAVLALSSCNQDQGIYTLYRSSIVGDGQRVHVATFNSKDGGAYNLENCTLVADLVGRQPNIETKFWCEKGAYKP
jgi:hypothetical protein